MVGSSETQKEGTVKTDFHPLWVRSVRPSWLMGCHGDRDRSVQGRHREVLMYVHDSYHTYAEHCP